MCLDRGTTTMQVLFPSVLDQVNVGFETSQPHCAGLLEQALPNVI